MNDLERRIQILEDVEAIKRLRYLYCYLVDEGIGGNAARSDEFITYFVDDAFIDYGSFGGIHHGKEAIARFFWETVPSLFSYGSHMVMNPLIEVNGDKAAGSWFVLAFGTTRNGERATYTHGKYDEEYIKAEGIWKWKSIRFTADFFTPFDEGWAKTRFFSL